MVFGYQSLAIPSPLLDVTPLLCHALAMAALSGRTGRNILANFLGQGASSLLMLLLVPVYISCLGIESYALIGLFAVLQAWLTLLDFGMTPALGREMARFGAGALSPTQIRDLLRSLEWLVTGMALLIILAMSLFADGISRNWLESKDLSAATVAEALSIMSMVIAARFLEGLWRSALFGLQQQVWFNLANTGLTLFRHGGAALLVAFVAPTTQAFFQWQLLASMLTLLVLGQKLYRLLPPGNRTARFSLPALREIARFALGMLGINLLAVMLMQLDKLLLSRLISLEALGHYLLAASVAAVLNALITPITQALSPSLVAAVTRKDPEQEARLYHMGAQLVTVIVAPAALIMMVFGEDAVGIWTGNGPLAAEVAPLLDLLALGTFLNGLMHLGYFAMAAHGWTRLSLVSNILAVCVMVPLLLLAAPVWGGRGAAAIWVIVNAGYVLFQAPLLHRQILKGEMWRWYLADVALPLLAAVMGVGLAWWLRTSQPEWFLGRPALALVLALAWVLGSSLAAVAAGEVRRFMIVQLRYR